MFYTTVVQAVLLLGSYLRAMSESTVKKVYGTHVGFQRQVVGKRARRSPYGVWETGEVLRAAGIQTTATYIGRIQGMVARWVNIRPIFKLCAQ